MLRARPNLKNKLSATLKSWLPILQSDPLEIEETLLNCAKDNPFVRVQSGMRTDFSSHKFYKPPKNALGEQIERLSVCQKSLHDTLSEQLLPPLFPTEMSLIIAADIIDNLSPEGYFEGDIQAQALSLGVATSDYEKVRQRFAYLDPPGIGACDLLESFNFQLAQHEELDTPTYELCAKILKDLKQHQQHRNNPYTPKPCRSSLPLKTPRPRFCREFAPHHPRHFGA
ncbi:hypothetical protein NHP190003_08400 [Helicobacter sp. NHP19-003]|uniref:RNA polymerase sigma factor 54 core-binding domain-containing protein n=1 Tax=Helicobacter gastrocanis TaxID=2849641 RepID=A0ABN6I1T0_9HELI|nr:hypothetical protein NHP190003_08400 [Helicobacter sp. NHP19-003]